MVKLEYSALLLLCLSYLVSEYRTSSVSESSKSETGELSVKSFIQEDISSFSDILSGVPNLPIPPVLKSDFFQNPRIFLERCPLIAVNSYTSRKRPLSELDRVRVKPIPFGLHRHWSVISAELDWFQDEKQADTLSKLFVHIVNDSPTQFREFESEFIEVFGVDYKTFSMHGRSVLGWLIAFGSSDILLSTNLSEYKINPAIFEKSSEYLSKSNHKLIARVINSFPFLIKSNLARKKNILQYAAQKAEMKPEINLAFIFINLESINMAHISALIPLFIPGFEFSALISLASKICFQIKFSLKKYSINQRDSTIKSFKSALNSFFMNYLADFSTIGEHRFSLAKLFIDNDNYEGLDKIISIPDNQNMLVSLGNGRSLIQMSFDSGSLNCFKYLSSRSLTGIISPIGGHQSMILQSIYFNSKDYLNLCLDHCKSNDKIQILGIQTRFTAVGLAILFGRVELLKIILNHFQILGVDINIRDDLDSVFDYLLSDYMSKHDEVLRQSQFIHHDIWVYLIQNTNINIEVVNNRSLLDLAVLDRNSEIVKMIISELKFNVNTYVNSGPIRGNCLRFLRSDILTLNVLLGSGIDIDCPVTRILSIEPILFERTEQVEDVIPSPVHLLIVSDESFHPTIQSLSFSLDSLESAQSYADSKSYSTISLFISRLILNYESQFF